MSKTPFNGSVDGVSEEPASWGGRRFWVLHVTYTCGHRGTVRFGGSIRREIVDDESKRLISKPCSFCRRQS